MVVCNLEIMTHKLLSQNYLHQIFNNQIFTRKLSKNSNNFRKTTGCFEIGLWISGSHFYYLLTFICMHIIANIANT